MNNAFGSIVKWCNQNNGFTSAGISAFSVLLSIIAIIISIRTNKTQIQVGIFEHRHSIYTEIERIYGICKSFSKDIHRGTFISNRKYANMLLYRCGSKEYKICEELIHIEKQIIQSSSENEDESINTLKHEYMNLADELVPDIERELQLLHNTKSGFYLLYPNKYHEIVNELLEEYELFYITHFAYEDAEFSDLINRMKTTIDKLEKMDFSNAMVRYTLAK